MRKIEGYFLIIFSGFLYGTIPIFATLLKDRHVSTLEQIVIRLVISLVFFLLYYKFYKNLSFKIKPADYKHFVWFGLVGIAMLFTLYMSAAVLTSVTIADLLLYTQPVYTLLISRFILKKHIKLSGLVAICLSLLGIAVIFRVWAIEFESFSIGHLFGLGAGLCYGIYIIFTSKFAPRYGSPVTTFWSFLFGVLWLIPIWLLLKSYLPIKEVTTLNLNLDYLTWLILIGFALVSTIMAYLIFNHGIRTVEPHRAGVLILAEPLLAIALGALLLGQKIVLTDLLGGLLILTAFFILKRK